VSNVVRHATHVVMFLMLTGGLSNQQESVSEEGKQQAMKAYMDCLHAAAAKMDDGKSDAMTVAMAIKPLCAGEFARSVKLSGSGLSPYARNLFEERVQASQLELGATAVLDQRMPPNQIRTLPEIELQAVACHSSSAGLWLS
jgi:hypothetical protein